MGLSRITTQEEWLIARQELLAREKELARMRDALSVERRLLPMVEIIKDYMFEGFSADTGYTGEAQITVFLRDGNTIFRTYVTSGRDLETPC